MDTVKIYVDMISQPCRTIIQFVQLTNIPHQVIQLDLLKGEHKQPPFSEKFRIQQLPAIEHGEIKLIEGGAIIAYLGEAFNVQSQWWPGDLQARSWINAVLHWHHSAVRSVLSPYLIQVIVKPNKMNIPCPPEQEEKLTKTLHEKLDLYEAYFGKNQFAGFQTQPSVADLMFYNEVDQLQMAGFDYSNYPNLLAWKARIDVIEGVEETKEKFKALVAG